MSNNFINCVECTKCRIQHVGETKRSVKEWFQRHFYNSNTCRHNDTISTAPTTNNYRTFPYTSLNSCTSAPPEHNRAKTARLDKESTWIHRLRTVSHGS
jgi:hypothetical protein